MEAKPQRKGRPRKRLEKQQVNQTKKVVKELEKINKKVGKQQPKKRTGRMTTNAGVEVGYLVSSTRQEKRIMRNLEHRLRKLETKDNGPKTQSVMSTTLTLGPIEGNTQDALVRKMRQWLNPCLLRPADSEETSTPLTVRASQYDLWRPERVVVKLQPLVGKTMVSGTIFLIDLDQEASAAKPETIDSIKARPHREVPIGSLCVWNIPKRFLQGPRAGWWYVDTNEDPSQSMGPGLNFWTHMQTINLLGAAQIYKVENAPDPPTELKGIKAGNAYVGPVFLAEVTVTYAFANYNPKPTLAQLVSVHDEHVLQKDSSGQQPTDANPEIPSADISKEKNPFLMNDPEGDMSLNLVVPEGSSLLRLADVIDPTPSLFQRAEPAQSQKAETFWSVAGDTINTVSNFLGPWGWLLKGGWFVVRKIFGPKQLARVGINGTAYKIYSSIENAAKDIPVRQQLTIGTDKIAVRLPSGTYRTKQINAGNLNQNSIFQHLPVPSRITPAPIEPPSHEIPWYPIIPPQPEPEPCPPPEPCPIPEPKILYPMLVNMDQDITLPPLYEYDFDNKTYQPGYSGRVNGMFSIAAVPKVRVCQPITPAGQGYLPRITFAFTTIDDLIKHAEAFDFKHRQFVDLIEHEDPTHPYPDKIYEFDLSTAVFLSTNGIQMNATNYYPTYGVVHNTQTFLKGWKEALESGWEDKIYSQFPVMAPIAPWDEIVTPWYGAACPVEIVNWFSIKETALGDTLCCRVYLWGESRYQGVLVGNCQEGKLVVITTEHNLPLDWRRRTFLAVACIDVDSWKGDNDNNYAHVAYPDRVEIRPHREQPIKRENSMSDIEVISPPELPVKSWKQLTRELLHMGE